MLIKYLAGIRRFILYKLKLIEILSILKSKRKKKIIYDLKGKTIVNFGDSIFGNSRPPFDISTYIADKTGAVVHNVAFGGCRMGKHVGHYDAFSMYRLADAVVNNDFSLQAEALNYKDRVHYAEEPLAVLKNIDFDKVDIITIAYGVNDFLGKNSLDNDADKYDISTFGGALRYSINALSTAYPHIKIVLCTPIYCFWIDKKYKFLCDSDSKEINGNKLTDFFELEKKIAEEYGVFLINNYSDSGINKFSRAKCFNFWDPVHPNKHGLKLIAENMAKELKSL